MPRMLRSMLVAALAALALPAAASADTKEVTTAAEFTAAAQSAVSGDVIHVHPGVYVANVSVANQGVVIDADPGALLANASGATSPTLAFAATSGTTPDVVRGLFVVNTAPASGSGLGPAAVQVGAPGLTMQRALALSAAGDAVTSTAGMGSTDRTVTLDSTMLFATGKGAAAVRATATSLAPISPAGATTVAAHHVTALGDSTVILDNGDANGLLLPTPAPSGNIAATFTDSILLGKRPAPRTNTSQFSAPNTATLDVSTRDEVADGFGEAGALFVNPARGNYHLRADAPVRGRGGFTTGESATDIDGDAIPASGPTDLGADQFVNRPPTAALAAVTQTVRQNRPVTFDASGSRDPDANIGGGIAAYHWNFGDGQTTTTTTPTTTHAYAAKQAYSVTVTVTDRQGATSGPSGAATFTVIDGVPPTITVAGPRTHQKIALYKTRKVKGHRVRTHTRLPVAFFGGAADDVAVGHVVLALRTASSKNNVCKWFDGKRSLRRGRCTAPRLLTPTLLGGGWRYALPLRAKLSRGAYKLYAIAVDSSGLASPAEIVSFRLR